MSKNLTYKKLIQSKRWQILRLKKLSVTPVCEICQLAGRTRAAQCVHHIIAVERAKSEAQAEMLCYSFNNLQSLCLECHKNIHNRSRYNCKEAHQANAKNALVRWREKHKI